MTADSPEQAKAPQRSQRQADDKTGGDAIGLLRVLGYLDLVGGIVGAFVIWIAFGQRQDAILGYSFTEANPAGIMAGIAVLLQGFMVCALCLVLASMADALNAIKRNTSHL